jgi:hypothetical protein
MPADSKHYCRLVSVSVFFTSQILVTVIDLPDQALMDKIEYCFGSGMSEATGIACNLYDVINGVKSNR